MKEKVVDSLHELCGLHPWEKAPDPEIILKGKFSKYGQFGHDHRFGQAFPMNQTWPGLAEMMIKADNLNNRRKQNKGIWVFFNSPACGIYHSERKY